MKKLFLLAISISFIVATGCSLFPSPSVTPTDETLLSGEDVGSGEIVLSGDIAEETNLVVDISGSVESGNENDEKLIEDLLQEIEKSLAEDVSGTGKTEELKKSETGGEENN